MTRNRYGGDAATWFVYLDAGGGWRKPIAPPTVTFWSGTPDDLDRVMYDDLRAIDDAATVLNSITGLANGTMPEFDGPDDESVTRMWASTDDGVTGTWITTTTMSKAGASGQFADLAGTPTIPSTAADVGAVATEEVGAANGVAPLDADSKLPEANVPDRLSDVSLAAAIAKPTSIAAAVGAHLSTTHSRDDSTTALTLGKDEATGKMYGIFLSNTHFAVSTDGTNWTDQAAAAFTYWTNQSQCMYFTAGWMYHTTSDGRIFRAPKDDFSGWVDISAPVPATTTGRAGVLVAYDSGVLLYTNYDPSISPYSGSFLWRSADNGDTWTEVMSLPDPQSRHGHAVRADPWHDGDVYWMVGDDPGLGVTWQAAGLYKSSDYGLTWTPIYTVADRQAAGLGVGRIGIDMIFPKPVAGLPEMVIFEGDVTGIGPLLFVHYKGTNTIEPLVWPTGAQGDPESTSATVRGIALTPDQDCVFFTTTENGAAGSLSGIYVAKAPLYRDAVLLEDTTGAEPPGYIQTVCSPTEVHQRTIRFNLPKFSH